jgi:DsbC/DsbD-like thiol-disulfide interchange protein
MLSIPCQAPFTNQTELKQTVSRDLTMRNKLQTDLASCRLNLMQKPFQLSSPRLRVDVIIACASLVLLLSPGVSRCDPYTNNWIPGPKSALRLIAAGGGPPESAYRAGIEIQLDPGAFTYWRMPGSAGIPPEFSFEGSANAAEITVSYPAPVRIMDDGIEVFGYRDHVIFPLRIKPLDAGAPVHLALALSYGVCARVCLPGKGEAKLTLLPDSAGGASVSAEARIVAAADALVPVRLSPQDRDAKVAITRDATAPLPTWRLSLRAGAAEDLFAEAPQGWYFDTRAAGQPNEFSIIEVERPREGSPERPPVILTVKNKQNSYEFAVDLDTASGRKEDVRAPKSYP